MKSSLLLGGFALLSVVALGAELAFIDEVAGNGECVMALKAGTLHADCPMSANGQNLATQTQIDQLVATQAALATQLANLTQTVQNLVKVGGHGDARALHETLTTTCTDPNTGKDLFLGQQTVVAGGCKPGCSISHPCMQKPIAAWTEAERDACMGSGSGGGACFRNNKLTGAGQKQTFIEQHGPDQNFWKTEMPFDTAQKKNN